MTNIYKLHPWHGVEIGNEAPELVTAFIEIIPSDTVKYEIDKHSGYLKVDRPQKFSNIVPALYGFIPRTYCKEELAKVNMKYTGRTDIEGDGDPLDILVLTEREITHGDIIVKAFPIGGFRLVDNNEADDKIIAVSVHDSSVNDYSSHTQLPAHVGREIKRFFQDYKVLENKMVEVEDILGPEEALVVIRESLDLYRKLRRGEVTKYK